MTRNPIEPSRRRWRHRAIGGAVIGTAGVVALTTGGLGGTAGAAKVEPSTTVVAAGSSSLARLEGAAAQPVREAVGAVWPGVSIEAVHELVDADRNWVEVTGTTKDGSRVTATVYRHFDRTELDDAGLEQLPSRSGTTWVGVADTGLTSIYHLRRDGVGVWVGIAPSVGAEAPSPRSVQERAEALAADPNVGRLAREVVR